MNMGPIGMSSGMDINSMVSKIVNAERVPKQQRIDYERTKIDSSVSAYGRLRESLDTMKNLMANFRQEKAFAVRSVDTSEENIVTATASTDAIAGKYAVDVLQLAQSHKVASDVVPDDTRFGPGKLQISLGEDNFDLSLGKNSKLVDVVRAINGARDNPGIRASIIKDMNGPRLIVAANQSGAEKNILIDVEAEAGNELFRFEYKTIEQRVKDLEQAQSDALALLGLPDQSSEMAATDATLTDEEAKTQADVVDDDNAALDDTAADSDIDTQVKQEATSGRPEDTIPGWTETASGTLMDSYQAPEPELDEKALAKSQEVPGWTNTASGTLTDSYVTPAEAQAKLEQELKAEKAAIAKAVADGDMSEAEAKQIEREKLTPEERERIEKVETTQAELAEAQRSLQIYKGMAEVQGAQDSIVVLDGVAELASSNNVIEDAIEGVDLTLKGTTQPGERPAEIGVEYDRQSVRADIEQFVDAYNQFFQVSKDLAKADPTTGQTGPLAGDSVVRSADSRLKSVFSSSVEGAPDDLKTLTEFGITTTRQGNLEINYQMLDKQLNNNFNKLEDFFGGNNGFAKKVEDAIHSMTGVTGSIRTREKSLTERNYSLNDDQVTLNRRMEGLEKRTHDKFAAMQDATGKMQSQLAGMMNALS
ncbi:flagellar filament capping protein FliD [Vibrio sp. 10N.286.49.C2]|uniref:flagellar filament capping protein FliD n=1 Tax=unclassified Vibrio TaxID=2614977 RepID=UPI000C82370C|nr:MULTISPECIES: flagellar filament capping protein FliD [unclassified Vibrio]PMH39702.1 flagellar filament capping protein FliD [Vibrio sp. 10N.286.49.C2]PMH57679.1 flagellar filament capping protein FliD [Vibrio sp. 10N.286.49.B1]PMH82444.1 flagellar filament capping protein FliD [Vibrio sp. 10N.286.48.B7]